MEFAGEGEMIDDVERRFLAADAQHRRGWGPFARELAVAVYTHAAELDEAIGPLLQRWTLDRLPALERLCLRMALCELRHFPEIPLRVTINEYVELARMFSGEEATQYINAVLDRLSRDFPHKDVQTGEGSEMKEETVKVIEEGEPDHG